jgi:hypothetical protein
MLHWAPEVERLPFWQATTDVVVVVVVVVELV